MKKFAFAVAATLAFTAAQAATTDSKPAADSPKVVEVKAAEVKNVATKAVEGAKEATAATAPAATTESKPAADATASTKAVN